MSNHPQFPLLAETCRHDELELSSEGHWKRVCAVKLESGFQLHESGHKMTHRLGKFKMLGRHEWLDFH